MSDRTRDDRDRAEEPTPQDGPKGFYRKNSPYDPFLNAEGGAEEEPRVSRRSRRQKSRRNWRSMKPRPRESVEVVETRSYWLIALALVAGFLIGFVTRTLMMPHESTAIIPYVEAPGTSAMEKKPNLDEMERKTRQEIQKLNQKVQDNAMSRAPSGTSIERLPMKFGPPQAETPALLKLKPTETQ